MKTWVILGSSEHVFEFSKSKYAKGKFVMCVVTFSPKLLLFIPTTAKKMKLVFYPFIYYVMKE